MLNTQYQESYLIHGNDNVVVYGVGNKNDVHLDTLPAPRSRREWGP